MTITDLPQQAARPLVLVPGSHSDGDGNLTEQGTDTFGYEVLESLPANTLFRRGAAAGQIDGKPGEKEFRIAEDQWLRQVIDSNCRLGRWKQGKDERAYLQFVPCSVDNAKIVKATAGHTEAAPELKGLFSYPVFGPGLRIAIPGWNRDMGLYLDLPEDLNGLTPKRLSPEETRERLRRLTVDFPFKDEASFQNWVSLMLTVLLRPALEDGLAPMFAVTSPMERTGKSMLSTLVLGYLFLGRQVPTLQLGRDEAEREKRITSLLLAGNPIICADNLPATEVLDSSALAALLTSSKWTGRRLGQSEMLTIPNNIVLIANGNNLRASREVTKRSVPIYLVPKDDHPEDRIDFQHPDLRACGLRENHCR